MIFIKHVRNKIKSYYIKGTECYICNSQDTLEFHHLMCVSIEAQKIIRNQGYRDYPKDDDPRFEEIVRIVADDPSIKNPEHFYTLCKVCHKALHQRYGQNYVAWKATQKYIEKQKERHGNT